MLVQKNFETIVEENYMQVTQNNHLSEAEKGTLLIRIMDIELFPVQTTLSWEIEEPNELAISELFDRRFALMGGSNKEFLRLITFRILSKVKIGTSKFCTTWTAKVQYLQNFFMPELSLAIKEKQFLFFHGRFTFWRVGNAWKAKIC